MLDTIFSFNPPFKRSLKWCIIILDYVPSVVMINFEVMMKIASCFTYIIGWPKCFHAEFHFRTKFIWENINSYLVRIWSKDVIAYKKMIFLPVPSSWHLRKKSFLIYFPLGSLRFLYEFTTSRVLKPINL